MNINFYHPSVQSLKKYPVSWRAATTCFGYDDDDNIICGPTGALIPSRPISLYVKSEESPNSAIAGLNVKIGNVYSTKQDSVTYSYTTGIEVDFSRTIYQGNNPICQTIPFLEKIQSSLDFPVDFASLVSCLPSELNPNSPETFRSLVNFPGDYPSMRIFYSKLSNLLFNDTCIPIPKSPPEIEKCYNKEEGYPLGSEKIQGNEDKNCNCAETGIRIKTTIINKPPRTANDIADLFDQSGPRSIYFGGIDLLKLWLLRQGAGNWAELTQKTDTELKELITDKGGNPDIIGGSGSSHVLTLINATRLPSGAVKLTLRNSWGPGPDQEFDIEWFSNDDLMIYDNNTFITGLLYITVEKCNLEKNKICDDEQSEIIAKCKNLGYDSANLNNKPECPCECDQTVNNRGITIQKIYDKYKGKCRCPKAARIMCGPNYNSKTETVTEDCDCVCKDGSDVYPCSGYDEGYATLLINKTLLNIVSVNNIKLV
jgi:hypothetical protein